MHHLSMIASLHPMTADTHIICTPQPYRPAAYIPSSLSIRPSKYDKYSQSIHSPFDQLLFEFMRARKLTKKQASKIQVANT